MESAPQTESARGAIVRTSQACERCRSLKTRCLPSDQPAICRRCLGARRECIWAEAPRRARKLRAPSRISQVEQKIDGIVASLNKVPDSNPFNEPASETTLPAPSCPAERPKDQQMVAPGSWWAMPSSFELQNTPQTGPVVTNESRAEQDKVADEQYIEQVRHIHTFENSDRTSQSTGGLFRPSQKVEPRLENDFVGELISSGEADTLIQSYRKMATSFPFVLVPSHANARNLHAAKPMLFLAIITAASWQDHQRQLTLDKLFRVELANRSIVTPQKNIGLVQSVLVYLSWYHFVFSHKTQQIFFLHHLLIGTALDIGLHQDYQPLQTPFSSKPQPISPQEQRERQRTFLGCYYLSSMVSSGLQKPNSLKYMSSMTAWAQSLQSDREFESDSIVAHLIALRRIEDQIQETLFTGSAATASLTQPSVALQVGFIRKQLEEWMMTCNVAGTQRLLTLSSSFTNMQLHSVALRSPESTEETRSDMTRLKALLATLESGKQFFDTLLSLPLSDYHIISFTEWMRLPSVIMTMARLCIPTDAHEVAGWDVIVAQDRLQLSTALSVLSETMRRLSTYDKVQQSHPDFWHAMQLIIDLTRTWYMRKISPSSSNHTPSDFTASTSQPTSGATSVPRGSTNSSAASLTTSLFSLGAMDMDIVEARVDVAEPSDPFDFMRNADLDMERLFEIGIWGDEAYHSMGFGSGTAF